MPTKDGYVTPEEFYQWLHNQGIVGERVSELRFTATSVITHSGVQVIAMETMIKDGELVLDPETREPQLEEVWYPIKSLPGQEQNAEGEGPGATELHDDRGTSTVSRGTEEPHQT